MLNVEATRIALREANGLRSFRSVHHEALRRLLAYLIRRGSWETFEEDFALPLQHLHAPKLPNCRRERLTLVLRSLQIRNTSSNE